MTIGPRWASISLLLVSGAVIVAVQMSADAGSAHATRAQASQASAVSAGTQSVNETIRASMVSHHGTTSINDKGSGSGTYACRPLTVQISISGDTEASISFICTTRSGSMSGRGNTSFAASGQTATFNGNLSITHGTGEFAHASAAGLHIQGTLARHSYALSARVTGTIRL
jgi:hypothetical protein